MYDRATLADYLGDRIVYRNLQPSDPGLPGLSQVWQAAGLDTCRIPRKTEPAYAAVVLQLLTAAQAARGAGPLRNVLFIGDTPASDGGAARNMAALLPLRGFIGADRLKEAPQTRDEDVLQLGNRWRQLDDWLAQVQAAGFGGEATAVLVDIDKTFIGARGRNDHVIDQARVDAVRLTVEEVLGGCFDAEAFMAVYGRLYSPTYHFLTADNQDYLAYISLMVMGGVIPATEFWAEIEAGHLSGFTQFVTLCDSRRAGMAPDLEAVHREVVNNLRRGDPTPFKSFRYREFTTTVAHMDHLPDDTPRADLLDNEIVLTAEVAQAVQQLSARGALIFATSDKPDEASLPRPDAVGALPIHRVPMKVVGG